MAPSILAICLSTSTFQRAKPYFFDSREKTYFYCYKMSSSEEDDTIEYPTLTEPCKGTFAKGRKGGPVLIDSNSYDYRRNKIHEKVTNWVCSLRPKCKATCVTNNETEFIIRWTPHSHDPDPVKLKVKQVQQEIMETAASHPKLSTSHLVAQWQKKTMDPAERTYLPSKRTMERMLKRKKQETKGHPKCPKSFDDLAQIPEKFRMTYDNKPFLLSNVATADGRIVIYASQAGLKLMARGETWTMDGTFSVVPKPFSQLYTIMTEIDGYSYPCAFCLLPNKKAPSYRIVMETIRDKLAEKGPINLTQVVMDFESPALNEFRSAFGTDIRVTGCVIHFGRSLRRRQGKEGLLAWQKKTKFQIFTGCLKGLAYVPPRQVPEYYNCLLGPEMDAVIEELDQDPNIKMEVKDDLKQSLNLFLEFFERTYLGKKGRAGWLKGKFALELWNQYNNVLEGKQVSTNLQEGWHSRLRKSLENSATYWTLVDALTETEATMRQNRAEDIGNGPNDEQTGSSRSQKEKRLLAKAALREIVSHKDEYEMVDYLKRVGYYKNNL